MLPNVRRISARKVIHRVQVNEVNISSRFFRIAWAERYIVRILLRARKRDMEVECSTCYRLVVRAALLT